MTPAITAQHLVRSFGDNIAVNGVNLSINTGEIYGFLGPNGAGKSTMLKILAGVHINDGGTIKLGSKDFITGSPQASIEQGIAVIYQEPSLFLDLTLAENVFIGRQPKKGAIIDWKFAQKEAARLFKELGVELNPKRQARGLSIADQQVVEIAKALSMNANIILMDEPTAGVDIGTKQEVYAMIRAEAEKGRTFIWYTTEIEELTHCDRAYVFRNGAIVAALGAADLTEEKVLEASFAEHAA